MIGFLLGHLGLIGGLLGAGSGVLSMFFPAQAVLAVKGVWTWLSHRSFWQLVCMGLAALLLVQHFELVRSRAEAAKWHNQFSDEHNGRIADRKSYTDAQAKAAADNKAHVQKVEQQYQRNSDDERQSYLDDLARLRGMRRQGSTAQSASGSAGSPAPHGPAAGTDANGLPVPAGDDLQAASEIELRLMHLQNYVEKLLSVDPNAP